MCSLRVYNLIVSYVFPQGIQPHSKLCVPSGYTIKGCFIVFYVLSGSVSGSPGGTTLSILVPRLCSLDSMLHTEKSAMFDNKSPAKKVILEVCSQR